MLAGMKLHLGVYMQVCLTYSNADIILVPALQSGEALCVAAQELL